MYLEQIYILTFFFSGFQAQDGRRGQHPHQANIQGDYFMKKFNSPNKYIFNYFVLYLGPRSREEHH